jgi:A/G-specific adenine glycosylase
MVKEVFSVKLISWYRRHKRDLPWRETKEPYSVWVSEIILQQTRVDQGMAYYFRFMDTFPDTAALADAPIDQVLKVWQGLGYYSRARNMHHAARQIMDVFGGRFPTNYNDLITLKGIGSYTAAAISSIAFNEPQAVLDGNVFRFLARHFGIATPIDSTRGKKEFAALASSLLPKDDPGTFNQAMMEFGALVCRPINPACSDCEFMHSCKARAEGLTGNLPVKEKQTTVRERFLHFFIYRDPNDHTLLIKRTGKDIWEGLYQFPHLESNSVAYQPEDDLKLVNVSDPIIHQLTHQRIYARFWHIQSSELPVIEDAITVSIEDVDSFPLPRLISRYLENL